MNYASSSRPKQPIARLPAATMRVFAAIVGALILGFILSRRSAGWAAILCVYRRCDSAA